MTQLILMSSKRLNGGQVCGRCGGASRLLGVEPHPTIAQTDLRTYVCTRCEALETESVALSPPKSRRSVPASRNIMLEHVRDPIKECYRRAAESRAKAERTIGHELKASLLDLEDRWLALARNYELAESLSTFPANGLPPIANDGGPPSQER